ncbi:hypothetical protein GCM10028807_32600 [Spirosoma daeguense]
MITVRADTLTFSLPESWDEVTLMQGLACFNAKSPRQLLTILSGLPESDFRTLGAPDIAEVTTSQLGFLSDLSFLSSTTVPESIIIDGKSIRIPKNIGAETTIGQRWDIEDELSALQTPETDSLPVVAQTLLSIYLAPLITGQPYTDIEQAKAVLPHINSLPMPLAMGLSAFFLTGYTSPQPSGRISFHKAAVPTMKRLKWRLNLRPALVRLRTILRFAS